MTTDPAAVRAACERIRDRADQPLTYERCPQIRADLIYLLGIADRFLATAPAPARPALDDLPVQHPERILARLLYRLPERASCRPNFDGSQPGQTDFEDAWHWAWKWWQSRLTATATAPASEHEADGSPCWCEECRKRLFKFRPAESTPAPASPAAGERFDAAELGRLCNEVVETRRLREAIPLFVDGPDGRHYVNIGPEVSEADCRVLDAEKSYERAMCYHGIDLVARLAALGRERDGLREVLQKIATHDADDDHSCEHSTHSGCLWEIRRVARAALAAAGEGE